MVKNKSDALPKFVGCKFHDSRLMFIVSEIRFKIYVKESNYVANKKYSPEGPLKLIIGEIRKQVFLCQRKLFWLNCDLKNVKDQGKGKDQVSFRRENFEESLQVKIMC